VQPKGVAFPTDAKLMHRACMGLIRLAKKQGVRLRQTYVRVGKFALMKHLRYAHAKQFKTRPPIITATLNLSWTRYS
jgi:transposase, IS5 family